MKALAITFLAVTAFAVSCTPAAKKSIDETASTSPTQPLDKISMESKEATHETKDYAYSEKSEFVAKMQAQLDEIKGHLDQLSAKVEKSSDAARTDAKPKLEALREQAAKLGKRLEEAKGATESTWGDVKASFTKGYGELKEGFQEARHWISEKIAP